LLATNVTKYKFSTIQLYDSKSMSGGSHVYGHYSSGNREWQACIML